MGSAKLESKIVSRDILKRKIRHWRRRGRTIAFTNGCFDILHLGHVQYLQKAKGRNRILIVGLNSDKSIRKIKGPQRPIICQKARAAVLAALECVDYVVLFHEETPQRLIDALRPDVLIKGADWRGKDVAGGDIVRRRGGKVEYIKYIPRCSTTEIIQTILKKCA